MRLLIYLEGTMNIDDSRMKFVEALASTETTQKTWPTRGKQLSAVELTAIRNEVLAVLERRGLSTSNQNVNDGLASLIANLQRAVL